MHLVRFAGKSFLTAITFIIILVQCAYPIHHILVKSIHKMKEFLLH